MRNAARAAAEEGSRARGKALVRALAVLALAGAAIIGTQFLACGEKSAEAPADPVELEKSDPRYPGNDPRYAELSAAELPLTECLKDTVARFLPYWHGNIGPAIRAGKQVLVAAHGNSIRALVKYLDDVSDTDIVEVNIPTGVPLVYELDKTLRPLRHYYLGDPAAIQAAMQAVAAQGKAR